MKRKIVSLFVCLILVLIVIPIQPLNVHAASAEQSAALGVAAEADHASKQNKEGSQESSEKIGLSHLMTSTSQMKVTITKPMENTLYIRNKPFMNLQNNTCIYGPITITVNVTSNQKITMVKFYIDGRLKKIDILAPYTYRWNSIKQWKGLSLKHTIKVIAYDNTGTTVSAELNVTKWRFHPIPFIVGGFTGIMGGVGVLGVRIVSQFFKHASSLIKHTTVRGLFFNVQNLMCTTSFYALHVHYKTNGPFKHIRGVINFESCAGGMIIGPMLSLRTGSTHQLMYGTFTFLGDIYYNRGGF